MNDTLNDKWDFVLAGSWEESSSVYDPTFGEIAWKLRAIGPEQIVVRVSTRQTPVRVHEHDPDKKEHRIDECRATSSSWAFMSSSSRKRRSFTGFRQERRFWTGKNKSSPILKFRLPPKQNHRDLLLFKVCSLSFGRLGLGLASKYPTVLTVEMSLRRWLGYSDGDLMRADSKPCSRLMRQTAAIFTVGGGLGFWVLCRLHYGPRITVPRSLRWATCGAVTMSSTSALLVRLFSPECEPQNIAAYDRGKPK